MGSVRSARAFMLLEVMVAIVIIGVVIVALFRGFIITLDSLQRHKDSEQALFLARSLMDDLVLEPPAEGAYEGTFAEDERFGEGYEGWKWKLRVEVEDPDYEERPRGTLMQELEQMYIADLEIIRETNRRDLSHIRVRTILMDPELYSQEALQANQLF